MDPQSQDAPHSEQVAAFFQKHRTGLLTIVFTDLVDSTALMQRLGNQAGATFLKRRRQLVREVLASFPQGEEIETAGDSFLLVFPKPSDAVRFALTLQAKSRQSATESSVPIQERVGLHLGELVIAENETESKAKDLYGIELATCSRVMSLAQGGQILLTRGVFDSARQVLKGEDIAGIGSLSWVSHGPYLLKGVDEPVEVCEVGERGQPTSEAPKTSEKAQRQAQLDEEPVLGWRPAVGQPVPNNTQWVLEEELGEGGFGEVWLAHNRRLKERRVFKFCFRTDRVRTLKRELTLFRVLKEHVGAHLNIVRLFGVNLEEAPFYLEEEYVGGKDLVHWCRERGGVESVPLETKLEIVAQAAEALQAAHDSGVIHRDIKPGNILLEVSGTDPKEIRVKLTDFGIGQVTSAEALAGVTRTGLTQTLLADSSSSTAGTQVYMAPELLAGHPASTRSDTYSLGVVLYQLLCGDLKRPVTTDWAGSVSDPLLVDDLRRCFAGKPDERFAGAGQLTEHLRGWKQRRVEFAREQAELAAARRAAYRRGVIRATTVALVVVMLFLGLALTALRQSHNAQEAELEAHRNAYVSDMNLAAHAWETGHLLRARELLANHRPQSDQTDLRGFEWRLLWGLVHEDNTKFSFNPGTNPVTTVALSSHGRVLVCAAMDGVMTIVDVAAGRKRGSLRRAVSRVTSASFSPDGRWLAEGRDDGSIGIWDAASWTLRATLSGHENRVDSLCFSPDTDTLLSTGTDATVRVWDFKGAKEVQRFDSREPLSRLSVSPNATLLATYGGLTNTVRFWGLPNLRPLPMLPPQKGIILSVTFASDGRTAIVSTHDSRVTRWDVKSLTPLVTYWQNILVGKLALSADGKRLATAGNDNVVRIWEVESGEELRLLRGHTTEISHLAISGDGSTVVSVDQDNEVKVWATNPADDPSLLLHEGIIVYVAAASDGRTLATSDPNFSTVRLWDLQTRVATDFVTDDKAEVTFSPDGTWLALRKFDGPIELWDRRATPYRKVQTIDGVFGGGYQLNFSPDSRILVFRGSREAFELWDVNSAETLGRLPHQSSWACATAFSPDGKTVATGSNAKIRLWDVRSQRLLTEIGHQSSDTRSLCFTPDGGVLLAASGDTEVRRWDVTDPERPVGLPPLRGHTAKVPQIAISPDGNTLASVSQDGTLRLWDMNLAQEVAALRGHSAIVHCLAWSPDGHSVFTGSGDATVRLWHAPSFAEIEAAEREHAQGLVQTE
jgi:WD40 repeat protein